jgi:Protein of unknown function (DUF3616)
MITILTTPVRVALSRAARPLLPILGILLAPAAGAAPGNGWSKELSGAARLPDGRLVFVDDESRTAIWIWNGDPESPPETLSLPRSLDDLEGVAADSSGHVFLLTSHSLTKRGVARADRRRLGRIDVPSAADTTRATGNAPHGDPKAGMISADDLLEPLSAALGIEPGAVNLEGLAWYPPAKVLFCGVREPLADGQQALVVAIRPEVAFGAAGGQGAVSEVRRLDLGGRGIRSLDFDPWRRGVLVLAGPAADDRGPFGLYLWEPEVDRLTPLQVPELAGVAKPEGVVALGPPATDGGSPILIAGEGSGPIRLRAILDAEAARQ